MDPETERLLQRTRQRREMLNQKLGKTPDPAPRKRVLEDTTNIQVQSSVIDDDSPKRQCMRENDGQTNTGMHGVKSRLNAVAEERMNWSDVKTNEPGTVETKSSPASSPLSRKSRFAKLAQSLDDFECDMSHPTVKKVEEKKPRWQPPRPVGDDQPPHKDAKDRHVSSPRKEYELYQGPKRHTNTNDKPLAPSPKKKEAPAPPPAPPVPSVIAPAKPPRVSSPVRGVSPVNSPAKSTAPVSPKKSSRVIELQQPQLYGTPKYSHQIRQITSNTPVNASYTNNNNSEDEPTTSSATERLASWKKTVNTPSKPKSIDPTELPLSERFAGWEQRVSQTPKSQSSGPIERQTPAKPTAWNEHINDESTDSCDSSIKPVSDIRACWKEKDLKNNPPKSDEPTAYSVSDRMSAWETLSSSNKVSYTKKVDPSCSPKSTPSKPVSSIKSGSTPNKVTPWKPSNTPNKGLTPQKSFKDSIEEKAAQIGRKGSSQGEDGLPPKPPTTTNVSRNSPHKSPCKTANSPRRNDQSSPNKPISPSTVGSATKTLQQKILQQVQYSKTDKHAERIRQERMAEVDALNNRFHNGILRDESSSDQETVKPLPNQPNQLNKTNEIKESIREKARQEFNSKLQALGFEISDDGDATYDFNNGEEKEKSTIQKVLDRQPSSATKKPSSMYKLVSQMCNKQPNMERNRQPSSSSLKKVTFEDHNSSTESDSSAGKIQYTTETETEPTDMEETDYDPQSEELQSETQESFDDSFDSMTDSSIPESYRGPNIPHSSARNQQFDDDDDDVSMSAFVPDSVRRESIMPKPHFTEGNNYPLDEADQRTSYQPSSTSCQESEPDYAYKKQRLETDDESDEDNNKEDIDDLLDEALDDISQVEMRRKEPQPVPRKRRSHMVATTEGEMNLPKQSTRPMTVSEGLAYSVSMYRSERSTTIQTTVKFRPQSQEIPAPSQRYSRNSHYVHEKVVEEDIEMPRQLPPDVQRKTIKERIKELHELVSQEQNIIMQTSNALNKCCSGDSLFAGSAEQVECNRLLLVSCQRRQAYLTEIQRLKETGQLESENQQGPKGSLTISDIRLPLKKDFVTKIGTASDNTVHYFILLIRNGPQVIFTQMLSTHDPMMRGSLDFPNLIKIHGICSGFKLDLEIYSMSVSREVLKDKKKKTPKKHKHMSMTMESPGGPTAVRTTSFTLITTLRITMKCLDKSSFSLERIPFLSPLHGMIYMRLKCMMEQNVEERGFLTMFEDVSGLGSWHRRWCVLTGNKLAYWKYPDDETRKDPMGFVDLKRVITEKVGLIPRDICARPHTFELVAVRPPRRGEQDTLVTKTYNTMTTHRHMLSADTKEERIVWCNKINRSLANIRTWNADAMRPIKSVK